MPGADPGVHATPGFGTLGPGSDIAHGDANPPSHSTSSKRLSPVMAIAMGILLAGLVTSMTKAHPAGPNLPNYSPDHGASSPAAAADSRQLDRLKPQKQAETLLELAVGRSDGAVDQISSRVDRWQGKLYWDSQIATLTTAALSSNDLRVRESGIEVELAAYGLAKNSASLEYLLRTTNSSDHARKVWALWALGLLGNRGVESSRVVGVLTAHLKDPDEDSRRWAVAGLALTGTGEAIPLLLQTMHDDASPVVREAAACSLAESGMFTPEQRLSTVPRLLTYTDDPALSSQTHAWAFEALGDITQQRLPNDSAAWRSWYENQN
jgi:HEAT repeats